MDEICQMPIQVCARDSRRGYESLAWRSGLLKPPRDMIDLDPDLRIVPWRSWAGTSIGQMNRERCGSSGMVKYKLIEKRCVDLVEKRGIVFYHEVVQILASTSEIKTGVGGKGVTRHRGRQASVSPSIVTSRKRGVEINRWT